MIKSISSLLFVLLISLTIVRAQQTVGLFQNDVEAFNGYTLFSPSVSTNTFLIDNCGRLINSWDGGLLPGASTYLLENGDIIRAVRVGSQFFVGGGIGGMIQQIDWNDNLVWSFEYASMDVHHHHDMAVLPNGNVLLIAWESKNEAQAIAAGRDPDKLGTALWPDHIVEVQPNGNSGGTIVWEWHFWDHLIQDFDPTKANYGVVADHPELLDVNYLGHVPSMTGSDWIHCNAINYNAERDEIMLSSRHLNEIYIIDHSTTTQEAAGHTGGNAGKGGDFLYRYGNPQAYQRGIASDQKNFGQHDAQWIAPGLPDQGKIMFYNNGIGRPAGAFSSIDVIDPPMDSGGHYSIEPGEPFGPTELFWTYVSNPPGELFSPNISGAHRLPNGNTLICEGASGNFIEVSPSGERHWFYKNPIGVGGPIAQGQTSIFTAVFRAYRYGSDYSAFDGRDLTPGAVLELEPLPSDCSISVPTKELAVAKTIHVYPNPFQGHVVISSDLQLQGDISVIDALGRKVFNTYVNSNQIRIDLSDLEAGMYLLQLPSQSVVKLICYP